MGEQIPVQYQCDICEKDYETKTNEKVNLCPICWNALLYFTNMIKKPAGMKYIMAIIDTHIKQIEAKERSEIIKPKGNKLLRLFS